MASTEMQTADAMIAEFIRHQEAQVALLKRMFGSSRAVVAIPTKDGEIGPEKETVADKADSMKSGSSAVPTMHHLREASKDSSHWKAALDKKMCKSLMDMLKKDLSLRMLTSEGRTVLHVATICGCKPLVKQVLQDCLVSLHNFVPVEYEPTGVLAVFYGVDEKTKLMARDINEYFVRNEYPRPSMPSTHDGLDTHPNVNLVNKKSRQLLRGVIKEFVPDSFTRISNIMISFRKDQDYNFKDNCIEFLFHHACRISTSQSRCPLDFLRTVVNGCLLETGGMDESDGCNALKSLFELQDWKGNPPFHTIFGAFNQGQLDGDLKTAVDIMISTFNNLLESSLDFLPIFFNARDARGWTFLHKCAAMGYHEVVKSLLEVERIDPNPKLPTSNATPLHLAILHNHSEVVKTLIMSKHKIHLNAIFKRSIVYGDNDGSGKKQSKDEWSPLQLAAVLGLLDVVRVLLEEVEEIYDVGKRINKAIHFEKSIWLEAHDDKISALHMAAASGIPEVLRLFLNGKVFDPLKLTKLEKRSSLHFAIDITTPCLHDDENIIFKGNFRYMHPILKIMDFASLDHHKQAIKDYKDDNTIDPKSPWKAKEEYSGKKACITMLLQTGIDVWKQDGRKKYAEPGAQASTDVRLWWYERVAQEVLEAKKNLNNAGNAISVVAALVATASYVGPLQPPLGFATDDADPTNFNLVQATKLGIRVFAVSNCLSFYLAIGSIMFAIVPSLPMPQEGMFEEWQRSRRSVGLAMSFLLLSILGVLVSFAAASNVGMSHYYSWRHVGLVFYPTLLGGIACLLGIIVFFIRLLRLIFDQNESIRYVYKKIA